MSSAFVRLLLAVALALAAPSARAQHGVADVVYVPTPQVVVDAMLRMGNVGPDDYLIDLGSGDGRVVVTAAKQAGARALGVELDKYLLNQARENAAKAGVAERAQFRDQNLFETDLSQATVITTYLLPEMNVKLRPKILALKPGTRVVAHDYHMGDWLPDLREDLSVPEKKVGNAGVSYVYLWYVPARAEGVWRGTAGDQPLELALKQRYQFVTGVARPGKDAVEIEGGRLKGEEIKFFLKTGGVRREFVGRVTPGEMTGRVTTVRGGKPVQEKWQVKIAG